MILSFHESPDKSQISYFLLCNYIDLFIPVAIPESDRQPQAVKSCRESPAGWRQRPYYLTWILKYSKITKIHMYIDNNIAVVCCSQGVISVFNVASGSGGVIVRTPKCGVSVRIAIYRKTVRDRKILIVAE